MYVISQNRLTLRRVIIKVVRYEKGDSIFWVLPLVVSVADIVAVTSVL